MPSLAALLPLLLLPLPGPAEPGVSELRPGPAIERTLSGGEQHEYAISLVRGQILHLVVEQRGLDLVEELSGPDGRLLLRVDTARGGYGPEVLWAVAEATGRHRLRVHALDDEGKGNYSIRIADLRPSSPEDRARAAAEKVHMGARDFENRSTASSRRQSQLGLERASVLWRSVADPEQEALVWLDRARAAIARGDAHGAVEAAERALERARVAGDRQLEAKILGQIGLAREFLGDPQRGIEALERALALSRETGDLQAEASALHLAGWGYWNLGRYQEALDLDQQALSIGRSSHDREAQAWALNGLGVTYWALGDPEKSIAVFEEALGLWRRLSNRQAEAFTLENLGFSYWSLGASRRALDAYEQALPVVRSLGDRLSEAFALNNIGLAWINLGDPERAASTLKQAVSLWKAVGNTHGMALSLNNLGSAEESLGRPAEALATWKAALAAAREAGDRRSEANTLGSMARLAERRGDLDEARAWSDESLVIIESLRGQIAAPGFRSSFLSSRQDDYAIAMDIRLRLEARDPGRGHAAAAFQVSEKARARALVDAIAEARLDLEQDLPEDLRRREKDLGAEIKRLQADVATAGASRPEAEKRLDRAEEEWDRLISEMRQRTPRYALLRYPEPVSEEQARRALDSSTAIVSYSMSGDRVLVFVLTASRLSAKRLAVSPANLAERVEDFVALIARDDEDRWKRLGARLYGDLVEPWLSELPAGVRRLIFVPDGVLLSLPFEVLAPASAGGRRLVEAYAVSYAPSVTALAHLEGVATPGTKGVDILVVADPLVTPGARLGEEQLERADFDLAPLPHALSEARAIARFGGPGTEVLTGAEASETRLREAPLERFGVIHFATHGLLNARHPSRSALLLATEGKSEGLLTAREIYRLRLRSGLVVLAACQTARGRILAGEGVEGLAQAFFHAGASSVVASLWDVNDRRAERLMKAFYGHLAAGESKSDALTSAKRELLAEEPGLAPRYWAPFVMIGAGRGVVALQRPAWWRFF